MKCKVCKQDAEVALKSHNAAFCGKCYLDFFRRQVQKGIESQKLFGKQDKILVALSGGKDSLALMLELGEIGYNVTGLHIDLNISNSSAQARHKVEEFCRVHNLPLKIVDLAKEGLAIHDVKKHIHRPICSVCGKIKRYYFNRIAVQEGFSALATGHNLDDEVSRLFSNTLRWDNDYLADQGPALEAANGFARKVKPFWRLTEFETANYAFLRSIEHHLAPCPYSGGASFSVLKGIMNRLEEAMPGRKLDFYQGFLAKGKKAFMRHSQGENLAPCLECGSPTSSGDLCGICRIRIALRERMEKP